MTIALYMRVSTVDKQEHASQEHGLKEWARQQTEPVAWFTDKASGKDMERPGFKRMMEAVRKGKVRKIVVAALDRLGRNTRGLLGLVEELKERKVGLLSLRENFDPFTPMGQFVLTCMAGIAELERENIRSRIKAGIEAKRLPDGSIPWAKGPKVGTRVRMTAEKEAAMLKLLAEGMTITEVGKAIGLSRPTLYAWLRRREEAKGGAS